MFRGVRGKDAISCAAVAQPAVSWVLALSGVSLVQHNLDERMHPCILTFLQELTLHLTLPARLWHGHPGEFDLTRQLVGRLRTNFLRL